MARILVFILAIYRSTRRDWLEVARSVFSGIGFIAVLVTIISATSVNIQVPIAYTVLFAIAISFLSIAIDGYCASGYLRDEVLLKYQDSSLSTEIYVKFGDMFEEKAWYVIPVNDFFDSRVDESVISKNSLHGYVINTYWNANENEWRKEIDSKLGSHAGQIENRASGLPGIRYPIGTTVVLSNGWHNFIFVALGTTNSKTNETSSSAVDVLTCYKKSLIRARSVCSGGDLALPLMGLGLARSKLKPSSVIDLAMIAISEESKGGGMITKKISIFSYKENKNKIDLISQKKVWRHGV